MMKSRNALLPALAIGALALAGTAFAQDNSGDRTPPPIVTVRGVPPAAPTIGTPPPFKQLSGGGQWITQQQAEAFPPLANDFLDASHGAKRINKKQYEAWVKQLQ